MVNYVLLDKIFELDFKNPSSIVKLIVLYFRIKVVILVLY